METKKTYCRICEALCGLEVDVDGDQIVKVRPDKTHPVSQGYACAKGIKSAQMHQDPRRVNHPLKKVDGSWRQVPWEQAIAEIGARTQEIVTSHSPRSVALYTGNPTFFNTGAILFAHEFAKAIGSPNHFASHSIDVNNKFYVAQQVYGRSLVHPLPDFAKTEFLMCFGTNPMVSQMSVLSIPNAIGKLQAIEDRGGRVVMIDPRRTETASKLSEHHFIRPGTDVYLLLAMLHVLGRERPDAAAQLDQVAHGAEAFLDIGRAWSPTRVSGLTGLTVDEIEELAHAYLAAKGASLYMSTGVNMGPFGSVCYWLIQGLSLLSGNLDSSGGMVFREGPYNGPRLWSLMDVGGESQDRTLVSNLAKVSGAFPVAALAEEIETDHPERIRALFINAGNPSHAVPGDQLGAAIETLDLMVCVDIFHNETNAQADYLLPATGMLERSDFPLSWMVLQNEPWAQFTEAMVSPQHERRPEWEIFSDLARACKVPRIGSTTLNVLPRLNRILERIPGLKRITPDSIVAALLWSGRQVKLSSLRQKAQGLPFVQPAPGKTLGQRLPSSDHKMSLTPDTLMADLTRVETFAASEPEKAKLLLIGQRDRRTHNSWIKDRTRPDGNVATMHPEDARARNIGEGDKIAVKANGREIIVPMRVSEEIMPGVISVPHGWGEVTGANVNLVMPGGASATEPLSGQAIMTAHPVDVERAHQA